MKIIQEQFEKSYVSIMGWEHIPNSDNGLVYVDIKKYNGKEITIEGVTINKGDTIAEMHIDNLNISRIDNSMRSIMKSFQNEMICLVNACNEDTEYSELKAVYGVTVLHPLLKYLGFTSYPLESPVFRMYLRWYENMLRNSFSTGASKNSTKKNDPMKCWITIEKLSNKFQKRG